ncbi:hypothetical protein D3C85_649130 [compost metagenome]
MPFSALLSSRSYVIDFTGYYVLCRGGRAAFRFSREFFAAKAPPTGAHKPTDRLDPPGLRRDSAASKAGRPLLSIKLMRRPRPTHHLLNNRTMTTARIKQRLFQNSSGLRSTSGECGRVELAQLNAHATSSPAWQRRRLRGGQQATERRPRVGYPGCTGLRSESAAWRESTISGPRRRLRTRSAPTARNRSDMKQYRNSSATSHI